MIEKAAYSTAIFLLKTLPIVAIAIYFVSYTIKKGYMERFAHFLQPMLKKFGVNEIAAVSVAACFISPTASYSILSQAWREGRVDGREIIAISFLNSFPSVFSHLYAYFIPFVIPVLGFAGIVYTSIRFAVAIIKSAFGLILSRKWGNDGVRADLDIKPISPRENIVRIATIMAVTYFAVSLASEYGLFGRVGESLAFLPLNPNALAIAGIEFFNIRAAVVLAAGFIDKGLHWKWAVIGLILGNIISFSTRAVKHSLPMHVAMFGKFGVKIVLLNSIATLVLDVIFVILLLQL